MPNNPSAQSPRSIERALQLTSSHEDAESTKLNPLYHGVADTFGLVGRRAGICISALRTALSLTSRPLNQQLSASLGWARSKRRIRRSSFRSAVQISPQRRCSQFPLFIFLLMPCQPLLSSLLHEIGGGPVQVERRLLDRPNDFRIY